MVLRELCCPVTFANLSCCSVRRSRVPAPTQLLSAGAWTILKHGRPPQKLRGVMSVSGRNDHFRIREYADD
eukprot:6084035-Heterocapsa_arctica.AAC.1